MTTIKLKNGSGAPTAGDLVQGEPALDLTNKRLYTEDSGGTVIEVGTNPGTDVTFADNRKAVFGAGSDLQIYHDGSASYIADTGTGTLNIKASGSIRLRGNDTDELLARFNENGSNQFYYDSAEKLATTSTGIDVTGTVTAHGLNFDVADGVEINALESLVFDIDSDNNQTNRVFQVKTNNTTPLFTIQDGGNVGIGTDSPTVAGASFTGLEINGNGANRGASLVLQDGNGNANLIYTGDTSSSFSIAADDNLRIRTNALERMRIDSSGRVGIGVTPFSAGGNGSNLMIGDPASNVGAGLTIGATTTGDIQFGDATTGAGRYAGMLRYQHADNVMAFWTNSSERMRIDSSGNLLVGTTSTDSSTVGARLYGTSAPGAAAFTRDGSHALVANRLTSDGDIAQFRKGNTTVGTIGTAVSSLYIGGSSNGGIYFNGTTDVRPWNTSTQANLDNSVDLGSSSARFKDLYLSGRSRIDNNTNISMSASGDGQLMISGNGYDGAIALDATGMHIYHNSSSRVLAFGTNETERMRIASNGDLLVGKTSSSLGTDGVELRDGTCYFTNTSESPMAINREGNDGQLIGFYNDTAGAGSITCSGSTVSYNTSSDRRLKENIVDAPSASDDIDAIQVRSFDWKVDGSHQKYGMVAQELQSVVPEAASGDADSDEMMGVDYSKLVPMLVKEIQSLRARVAQLETN